MIKIIASCTRDHVCAKLSHRHRTQNDTSIFV